MDIQLKVSPEQIVKKADEIQGTLGNIRRSLQGLESSWNACHRSWEGEAAARHIALQKQIQQEAFRVLRQMEKWPGQMCVMAGVYRKAEAEASEDAGMLPGDILVS